MIKSSVPAKIPTVPDDQAVESKVQEENEKQSRDDKQESLAPDEEETQKIRRFSSELQLNCISLYSQ
ncbi:hypothetical protein OXYTRIMIC_410 [Oxytricha trifallax]|uniref:Uncharacterized protein n=1 Tax=Oxytricha trifallax TaxID=1172189 RepID=A0A073I0K4_9SPIT|nr:hypothetical protein OXYTRIMIC_410 [Oxytricha trifallax]